MYKSKLIVFSILIQLILGCGRFRSQSTPFLETISSYQRGMYLTTYHGLLKKDSGSNLWEKETFCNSDETYCIPQPLSLTMSETGLLLGGEFMGLHRIKDFNKREFESLSIHTGFKGGSVFSSYSHGGKIFAGTAYGIGVLDISTSNWSNPITVPKATRATHITSLSGIHTFVYAVNKGGTFFESKDLGTQWNTIPSGSNGFFDNGGTPTPLCCVQVNDSYVFVGSRGAGLTRKKHGTTDWSITQSTDNGFAPSNDVTSLLVDGTSVYVGTRFGGLSISHDNGDSWKTITDSSNSGFPDSPFITSLFVKDGEIYAGTYFGELLVSTNQGLSWRKVPGLEEISRPIYDIHID